MVHNLSCRARHRPCGNATERRSYRYDSPENKKWKLHSTDQVQSVALVENEEKTWEACKELVSSLNFTREEADGMLGKAFGWVHSPYWGEERQKEVPKNEGVNAMLEFLRSLGLSNDDLHKLLKKFPEVLGCSLDDEVKLNIGVLEKEWGIKGKTLRSLLLRNPKVLGYNVDCKGDCIAKCTRCWARF
uniref:4-hydroxy-3-methylbut-2-en-1-yl diphosphate synthase n=1 Tax=Anthurium amnicola TaxID=1678845 RepID=A0A1D1ZG34_9ARAE